ncbi:phosphoribosylanthranilate isomerase [Litorivicinus sp.]|jgi:phosphoribosylanthranilate isomerase|nr:phosphoribosylanthranilate isomerase [Litorivicinus sp.]MDC1319439.1 phosphoribosylanthranilate isomerase [Litorivicinus sp.]|tara:strand:- start:57223 stop:57831 length:609 start_codon:yes stop_codon:yes gene_type:complete
MTRVKFCGFTDSVDVAEAVKLGADALGFVFYSRSPRAVTIALARELTAQVPAFVTKVGLFVNAEVDEVRETFSSARLNLIQFHGDETPAFCESLKLPYIRALRVRPELNIVNEMLRYPNASGFLLDAYKEGTPGGTGEIFDWDLIPKTGQSVILAGGLNPENAKAAIKRVSPWALDVSGGIESMLGRKDPDKMARFMAACRS